jgi:hypothetical protein
MRHPDIGTTRRYLKANEDRLRRNLKHPITRPEALQSIGVASVSLHERIDATTPAGNLQMHPPLTQVTRERAREIQEYSSTLDPDGNTQPTVYILNDMPLRKAEERRRARAVLRCPGVSGRM